MFNMLIESQTVLGIGDGMPPLKYCNDNPDYFLPIVLGLIILGLVIKIRSDRTFI